MARPLNQNRGDNILIKNQATNVMNQEGKDIGSSIETTAPTLYPRKPNYFLIWRYKKLLLFM